jgi:hypothetical protein
MDCKELENEMKMGEGGIPDSLFSLLEEARMCILDI